MVAHGTFNAESLGSSPNGTIKQLVFVPQLAEGAGLDPVQWKFDSSQRHFTGYGV